MTLHIQLYHGFTVKNNTINSTKSWAKSVRYNYKYSTQYLKKKGDIKTKRYFEMWKDYDPYYVIHKFLHKNDPDNPNFKYDLALATRPTCKYNLFKHYKKAPGFRFFWYGSHKKSPSGSINRYINYKNRNEFRFSKLRSFYHLLDYVHPKYKDNPIYIYYMNKFLALHGKEAKEYFKTLPCPEMPQPKPNLHSDSFEVHGANFSFVDKKNRNSPYDVYSPFYRTARSSKRRRFRSAIPLVAEERCKNRRERLLKRKMARLDKLKELNINPMDRFIKKRKFYNQPSPDY